MKHLVFVVIVIIFLVSCKSNQAPENENTNENATQVENTTVVDKNNGDEGSNNEMTSSNAGKVVKINSQTFSKEIFDYKNQKDWKFNGKVPCIVDFYADWCGPCKQIAPILDELAKEYKDDINIYKVDTDKESDLAMAFGIQSIPSILFCPMEGEPYMYVGAYSKADYKKLIHDHLLK